MPTFKVAHIREQGVDVIIVPLESSFGSKTSNDQQQFVAAFQIQARLAGLAGNVVPVWDGDGGRMAFLAPHNQHAFFGSLTLQRVMASVTKEISW